MRRYGLVDIPDQASDIDAVPITRTITINGTTYDLSANRSWTVIGMAIGGTITSATQGSVLFAGVGGVLAQDNANFFWDDTNNFLGIGTNTPLTALHLKTSANTSPRGLILEQTSNDTIAGIVSIRKIKGTATVANADALGVYQAEGYDGTSYINGSRLRFIVDGTVATGSVPTAMQFLTGSSGGGTERARFTSSGNFLYGTTVDNGNNFRVVGQAEFGDFPNLKGVIAYRGSVSDRLGIFQGPIWMSNVADVSMYIDCGGSNGAGNQAVRIYTDTYAGVANPFPICIQGNGRETIFGQDTITTNASSLVTMVSTTKGFLPPRMTSAQRTAIGSPATGLIVYQTDGSAGLYVRNAAAWQLLGSGTGTVTSVSVVSANGFAGTVANPTTTPAITLSTTITGMLKGNGTAISAATAGTDYQAPITLTTTGTTGAATFTSNTLNIPNYSNGKVIDSGTFTPTASNTSNCTIGTIYKAQYIRIGDVVNVSGYLYVTPSNTTAIYYFDLSIPINNSLSSNYTWASGTCVIETSTGVVANAGRVAPDSLNSQTNKIQIWMSQYDPGGSASQTLHYYHYTYRLIA